MFVVVVVVFVETMSHYVAQACLESYMWKEKGCELKIYLPQPPNCQGSDHVSPHLAFHSGSRVV